MKAGCNEDMNIVTASERPWSSIRSKDHSVKHKNKLGLDMIIVDYLQLLSSHGRYNSRQGRGAKVSQRNEGSSHDMESLMILVR